MIDQEKTLRQATGHLMHAKRKINEAIGLGLALANGEDPQEPETPRPAMPFRPTSPDRDAARYPYMPGPTQSAAFMKPSRMPKRGRHGSRRRR